MLPDPIDDFLNGSRFAVAGASRDRSKFGNRVLRAYMAAGLTVHPINPTESEVEGLRCWPRIAALPEPVHGLSVITPPEVTERLVEEAAAAGLRRIWMQPGAESAHAVARAKELGLTVIAGGPCLLVELPLRRANG
jgi:predicted CoA-binding protein